MLKGFRLSNLDASLNDKIQAFDSELDNLTLLLERLPADKKDIHTNSYSDLKSRYSQDKSELTESNDSKESVAMIIQGRHLWLKSLRKQVIIDILLPFESAVTSAQTSLAAEKKEIEQILSNKPEDTKEKDVEEPAPKSNRMSTLVRGLSMKKKTTSDEQPDTTEEMPKETEKKPSFGETLSRKFTRNKKTEEPEMVPDVDAPAVPPKDDTTNETTKSKGFVASIARKINEKKQELSPKKKQPDVASDPIVDDGDDSKIEPDQKPNFATTLARKFNRNKKSKPVNDNVIVSPVEAAIEE